MKRIAVIMALVAFGLGSVFAQGERIREEQQVVFQEMLDEKGYENYLDESGDVVFTKDELSLFISVTQDPNYFSIHLPRVWGLEHESKRQTLLTVANDISARIKVAKVYMIEDHIWISAETLIRSYEDVPDHFDIALSYIGSAIEMLLKEMDM